METVIEILFDPLFHTPWLTGFFLAILLPTLGIYLRLRDEWLAAFGLAQMSAASGLIGFGLGVPIVIAGPLGGAVMALVKYLSRASNTAYALMILTGWSLTFIVAANSALGESIGHALIDGQLYFVEKTQGIFSGILCVAGLIIMARLSQRLLRAKLFPHYEKLNETNTFRWHLSFDILVAISMGVATASIGLMTAFAMVFIPAWLAFQIAVGWRASIMVAVVFNLAAYVIGFVAAIAFDQPYGPTQVIIHLALAAAILLIVKLTPQKTKGAS